MELIISRKREKIIEEAKTTFPDQNAINFSNKDLSHAKQSLLRKGPSFIPTPTDTNWYNLKHGFDIFFKMVTDFEWLLPIKSHNHIIT